MMIEKMKMHHVGIIYNQMEQAESFIQRFGAVEEYREYVDTYQAWCIFLEPFGGSKIELIVPTGGNLAKYNQGKGGIHHVAYAVDDVEAVRAAYAEQGIILLEKTAVKGAGNIIVNFMRPNDGAGVLVEFVQTI